MTDVTSLDYLNALYGRCKRGNIVFVKSTASGRGKQVAGCFGVQEIQQAAQFVDDYRGTNLFLKINVMDHQRTLARNPHGVGGTDEVDTVVGFHLDVDAGKSDKYLTPDKMLDALDAMPFAPSFIVQTNGDEGGFHAYWLLAEPFYLNTAEDRERAINLSKGWLEELRYHVKQVNRKEQDAADNEKQAAVDDEKQAAVDGTANIDRFLRPIGSLRSSGNIVRAFTWCPERRFTLDQFDIPSRSPKQKSNFTSEPFNGDSPIEKYLNAVGLNSVEAILQSKGYSHVGNGFWIRPGSESGAPTGEIYCRDGQQGFTVKSGAADPLCCTNGSGATGNWYSIPTLFASFHCNVDASNGRNPQAFKETAAFCKAWLDAQAPKADTSRIEAAFNETSESKPKAEKKDVTSNARVLFDNYLDRLRKKEVLQRYQISGPLDRFEIGPGLLSILGAPPGGGKTTFASQLLFTILEENPDVSATVANAEMSFDSIARRELVRRTRVNDGNLREADLATSDWLQIDKAAESLRPLLERVSWLEAPYTFHRLTELRERKPGLLLLDYLQKFAPAGDARQGVNSVMAELRHLCLLGWGVLALSATSRTHSKGGSSHDSSQLTMASFKESGEVEFNADAAYLLRDRGPIDESAEWVRFASLECVKNRHGAQDKIELEYNRARMNFGSLPTFVPASQGPYDFGLDDMDELEGFEYGA